MLQLNSYVSYEMEMLNIFRLFTGVVSSTWTI
jgi:hypothetical protein